jgi:hypothetical protein
MATNEQFYWPSVGTFVAAYGQFFMAANKGPRSPPDSQSPMTVLQRDMLELTSPTARTAGTTGTSGSHIPCPQKSPVKVPQTLR